MAAGLAVIMTRVGQLKVRKLSPSSICDRPVNSLLTSCFTKNVELLVHLSKNREFGPSCNTTDSQVNDEETLGGDLPA